MAIASKKYLRLTRYLQHNRVLQWYKRLHGSFSMGNCSQGRRSICTSTIRRLLCRHVIPFSPEVEEWPSMTFHLGGIFDAVFLLLFLPLVWYGFLLFSLLFYNATRLGIRQRATDSPTSTHQQTNNTPDPERPLRETRRDSELDRRSLNDYTNAREGRGRWEGGSKSRLWSEEGPALPFLYEFFSALSYFLIKQSSGFI